MIYKTYNFVESYSNADGTQKSAMVLNELGKLVRTQPASVILALKDAGIKVPRKPSKKDLVRIISANRRNRKMSENLALLITANITPSSGVIPKGVDKFDNLIDPNGSNGGYFYNANDDEKIPTLPSSAGLQGLAKGTEGLQGTENVGQGSNWLKNIGDFLKGRQGAKGNQTKSDTATQGKFRDWFNKNRGTIGQIAQTTYDSLVNAGKIPTSGGGGSNELPPPATTETWFQRNKTLVIVGGLIGLGAVAYFATRGKKGAKKGGK